MKFILIEQERIIKALQLGNEPIVNRIIGAIFKTGFYLFSPYVIVGNLIIFYALYQGIGYWISLVLLSVLFAITLLLLDWHITQRKSSHPQALFLLYYIISLIVVIPGVVWGVL